MKNEKQSPITTYLRARVWRSYAENLFLRKCQHALFLLAQPAVL